MANDKNGIEVNGKNYKLKIGSVPILISAPHAVKVYREDKVKKSDYLTGPLAIYLAKICDCSYFVKTYNNQDDPNYPLGITMDKVEPLYLKELINLIKDKKYKLVIDLHGCSNNHLSDCSLWSDNTHPCDENIINIFFESLRENNVTYNDGKEWLGGQVTRQISPYTNAFQIEVRRRFRSIAEDNFYLLKNFIDSMESSIFKTYEYSLKLRDVGGDKNGR